MTALIVTLKSNTSPSSRVIKLYPAVDSKDIDHTINEAKAFMYKMSKVFNGTYELAKVNSIGEATTIQKMRIIPF